MSSMEPEQTLAELVVGARGWLHEHWQDSYYPEDIPDDWRLGFYANEFNTLLVPWEHWNGSVDELEGGLEDTDDDFHLYLELPATQQSLPSHLSQVSDRVTGLVCTKGDPESWQAEAAKWQPPILAALAKQDAGFQRFAAAAGKPVSLVLIDSTGVGDLSMMREQLELALVDTGPRLDFIFMDEKPDTAAMQNTRVMAELMGA